MPSAAQYSLDDYLAKVPEDIRERFASIVELTDRFCEERLNDEYRAACRQMALNVCQPGTAAQRGKAESWASGIVYSVGWVNFLTDPNTEPYVSAEEIHQAFGVSSATMYNKARDIRESLHVSPHDADFTVPSGADENPMVWLQRVADGTVVDAGQLPNTLAGEFVRLMAFTKMGEVFAAAGGPQGEPATPLPELAYDLRITLLGTDPPIWRRVVTPDCTLEELHQVIQVAMGWECAHLYEFLGRDGTRYACPGPAADDGESQPASHVVLSDVVPARSRRYRFRYLYDFGDSWEHEIAVEKTLRGDQAEPFEHPVCREGARACPPEDIGGIWGYHDLLQALDDPQNDWHHELAEMYGEYDPESFDPDVANRIFDSWQR